MVLTLRIFGVLALYPPLANLIETIREVPLNVIVSLLPTFWADILALGVIQSVLCFGLAAVLAEFRATRAET